MAFYSTQVSKLVSRGKNGTILMAFEHTFDKYFEEDYLKTGKSLEPTGLDRYLIKVNQKKDSGTISLRGNLPCEELDRIYKLSSLLIDKEAEGSEIKDMVVYTTPSKFMRGFDNDKGHSLCYQIKITYQPAMRAKIKIEIKNFYAPVRKMEDGTTQVVGSQISDEKSVSMFITTNDWFDTISWLNSTWKSYQTAAFEKKFRKSLVPVEKKKS